MNHCEFYFEEATQKVLWSQLLSDLKTIVFDSLMMSCSMVFQPNLSVSGLLGVSKLLSVRTMAAPF